MRTIMTLLNEKHHGDLDRGGVDCNKMSANEHNKVHRVVLMLINLQATLLLCATKEVAYPWTG